MRSAEARRWPEAHAVAFWGAYGVFAGVTLFKLTAHRSSEAWIFGRYSLPYFVFLIIAAGFVLCLGFSFYRFGRRALYNVAIVAFAALGTLMAVEVAGQVYALSRPAYDALYLEPDRTLGWKMVPNFQFRWGGAHWYAREFNTHVKSNVLGFRDRERVFRKPEGVVRVALFGDSFVEAIQVSFEKTAAYLLEQRLNASARSGSGEPVRYEVLNFGISNYGVGQYLLAWEQYASRFDPDYVFVFLAGFHMNRTVRKYFDGSEPLVTGEPGLWIRPIFSLENGKLIREAPVDFEEAVKRLNQTRTETVGHVRRRPRGIFIRPYLGELAQVLDRAHGSLLAVQRGLSGHRAGLDVTKASFNDVDQQTLLVNLKVIEELWGKVLRSGGQLVLVDASGYFQSRVSRRAQPTPLPEILAKFCAKNQIGYIPLSDELIAAQAKGIRPEWEYDGHFNEAGNEIFADNMYRWVVGQPKARTLADAWREGDVR